MDSGLGSDEERRTLRPTSNTSSGLGSVASTKEQKQRHNERLLIGCFIDASSLSDDAEVPPLVLPTTAASEASSIDNANHSSLDSDPLNNHCYEASAYDNQLPKVPSQWPGRVIGSTTGNSSSSSNGEEERRQGALLFRSSIPQYSMLQMELNMHHHRLMSDSYSSGSQPDVRSEFEHDKEDEREKEDPAESNCDNFCVTNSTRQTNNDRIPNLQHSFPLNYCDNDVAAHSYSNVLPKINDKHCMNGNSETSTACATPFNSMVQLASVNITSVPTTSSEDVQEDSEEAKRKCEEEAENHKTSLGFYVDLNDVEEPQPPPTNQDNTRKKNIFSMVIDFEAPKKEKPRLPSSLRNGSANGSKSADCKRDRNGESSQVNGRRNVSSAGHCSASAVEEKVPSPTNVDDKKKEMVNCKFSDDSETDHDRESPIRQFVRLSDLDSSSKMDSSSEAKNNSKNEERHCDQHAMLDVTRAGSSGIMCRSIPPPPQSFVESPLFLSMSRSVTAYRSSPPPFSAQIHYKLSGVGNRASSAGSSRPSSGGRSVARLGTDLLRMFLEEIETDVQVSVNGRKLRAHRCILVSRCQYFAAALSGRSGGSSGSPDVVIPLDGFSYDSVHFAMCHIYSGASHVPDSVSLVELASLADLLCLEGLKEVVSKELLQKHCHSFHPPCIASPKNSKHNTKRTETDGGCVEGVLEVLPLAAAYGLDELYQKCLEWIAEHFIRVWPTRAFGFLPRELREKCHRYMEVHLLPETVLITAKGCLEICQNLDEKTGSQRWIETVRHLTEHLYDICQTYLKGHMAPTIESLYRNVIAEKKDWRLSDIFIKNTHMPFSRDAGIVQQLEEMMVLVCRSIASPEQICRCYARSGKLIKEIRKEGDQESTNNYETSVLLDTLNRMQIAFEEKMLAIGDKIYRCPSWDSIDVSLRERIMQLQRQQKQQEKDEDSSIRSTPSFKGSSPPVTRLPRATRTTQAREAHASRRRQQQQQIGGNANHPVLQSSSESSSRNSSPLTGTRRMNVSANREMSKSTGGGDPGKTAKAASNGTNGSPSLRRSLLMAARVPQQRESHVPPSPLQARRSTKTPIAASHSTTTSAANVTNRTSRSTLTQPTASSAAKSAPPRHIRSSTSKEQYNPSQQKSLSAPSSYRNDNLSIKHTRTNSTTLTRSMTQSVTAKHEQVNNKTTKPNVGVRRSPDVRQNRASTPTMARKKVQGSGASSGTSNMVSPCSVISESKYIIDSKATSSTALVKHTESEKRSSSKPPKETSKEEKAPPNHEETPTIQRSGTFLKEKPTVLTIEHQQQSLSSDTTVH